MPTDPAPVSSSSTRLGGLVVRNASVIALLVGLAGCAPTAADPSVGCLKKYPGWIQCCPPGDHIDNGTCCPAGMHALTDVEHEDWKVCVWDVDPCADAGAQPGHCVHVGADAAADTGADAP